jgi:hypothetical protein
MRFSGRARSNIRIISEGPRAPKSLKSVLGLGRSAEVILYRAPGFPRTENRLTRRHAAGRDCGVFLTSSRLILL